MVTLSAQPNRNSRPAPFRHSLMIGAVSISCILALAACSAQQPPAVHTETAAPQQPPAPAPAANKAIVPAAAPGLGSGLSRYGIQLSPAHYAALTTGNTLFRPLADGGKTTIFIAPNKTLSMFLINPTGQKTVESGFQTFSGSHVCWQLKGPKQPLCFTPYSNGRLLTLYFVGAVVQPAQFLVAKGNIFHLRPGQSGGSFSQPQP